MDGRWRRFAEFERNCDDLADDAEDVLRVVFAVGIVDDTGACVGRDAILVDDSFEGGVVAEFVVGCGGGNAMQGEKVVIWEYAGCFS